MIRAYPGPTSVSPGDTLTLHVSTSHPLFRVDFYRWGGQGLVFMERSDWHNGTYVPEGQLNSDWRWPEYRFPIDNTWSSGVYIAMFTTQKENGTITDPDDVSSPDGRTAKTLFVVKRNSTRKDNKERTILYKLPLFTYHAYNYTGNTSIYWDTGQLESYTDFQGNNRMGYRVTLLRPGGGTGGDLRPEITTDIIDMTSPLNTFAHWDSYFIRWLEKSNYKLDYCTDLDLHQNPNILDSYCLLLSVGHDEYWSENMRRHTENFIEHGGNVAFFSGNTCYWRVTLADNDTAFLVNRQNCPTDDNWFNIIPENRLIGVSWRYGGGDWHPTRRRPKLGYTVQHADHWVYDGTGFSDGDTFGEDEYLVGFECDGAVFRTNDSGLKVPTGEDGTPSNFIILGVGLVTSDWLFHGFHDTQCGHGQLLPERTNAGTMGIFTTESGGTVFNAATTDWARVMMNNGHVARITENVLNKLKTCRH